MLICLLKTVDTLSLITYMFTCSIAILKAKENSAYDQSKCTEGLKKSEVTQNWMLIVLLTENINLP